MSSYLVTGVAGFIGSMVAKNLVENGHQVIGVDNLSTGFLEVIPSGVEGIIAGAHEAKTYERLQGKKFDAIIHIAGQSGGEMSYEDPVYDLQSNAQSTLLLLDYARKYGCKKVIYASTVSVYGENGKEEILSEDDPTLPKSFYGVGKLASENYLRIYADQFGLDTVALRLFNIYGPGQNLKNLKQGMASIYLAQAVNNHHIHVKGSPDRFRDFVFIDDVVEVFNKCLTSNLSGYNFFNISTGKKTKVGELVNLIINALPYEVTTEFSGSTPGDVHGYTGSRDKVKRILDWEPKVAVQEGVKNMVDWALAQVKK